MQSSFLIQSFVLHLLYAPASQKPEGCNWDSMWMPAPPCINSYHQHKTLNGTKLGHCQLIIAFIVHLIRNTLPRFGWFSYLGQHKCATLAGRLKNAKIHKTTQNQLLQDCSCHVSFWQARGIDQVSTEIMYFTLPCQAFYIF